jgi:glycosyltransferase involved in cell wall biosynthesis
MTTPDVSPPKVSVIIPAYQAAAFIAEALDSVFAQAFLDFEVIVVNDGSPDSAELERAIAPYRDRIVYLKQDNRGPAGARNTGIQNARGKYVAFLDGDDCWLPEYLASQINFLEETPLLDAVYCDACYFGHSALAGKTYMQTCPSKGAVTLESLIRSDCQPITSCTIISRRLVVDAGLFDERVDIRGCEDYDLWLRIACRGGRIGYHREVLGRYRSRPGSLSSDGIAMLKALVEVYEKALSTMDVKRDTRELLRRQLNQTQAQLELEIGKQSLARGNFQEAKHSLTVAYDFFHTTKLKLALLGLQFAPRFTRSAVMIWQKLISPSKPIREDARSLL